MLFNNIYIQLIFLNNNIQISIMNKEYNTYRYAIFIILLVILIEYISIKLIKNSLVNNNNNYIIGILLYIVVGWLLYKLLIKYSLITSRFLISRILIVLIPLILIYLLEEKSSINKKIGLLFIIIGLILLEYEYIMN